MEIAIISLAAFFTAILTFFCGFGLGTIMLPVFAVFFPVDLAVALTGVVHFFNNLFKLFLVGRNANKEILIRFGIPAILASFAGAWVLLHISGLQPLFTYGVGTHKFEITTVKFTIALLLIFFTLIDILPLPDRFNFGKEKLPMGGLLSGFFGGLSGNQGALRSAFLIKAGLSKEAFIGTSVVIACFIDFTRISVYATRFSSAHLQDNITLIIVATTAAIAGAYTGNKLLKKVTLKFLQKAVATLLLIIAIALGSGII
jgi:uncharacterized protein